MTSFLRLFTVAVTYALLTYVSVSAQTQSPSSDESAIRHIVQQLQDGWNAQDGKAFAARFSLDADYVVVNGARAKGRGEIEKGHTAIFSTIYKDSRNVGTVQSVRFLRPDVAVVHVEWNLDFTMGGEARKARTMNTMIMTKERGEWSIAVFQNTPIQEQRR